MTPRERVYKTLQGQNTAGAPRQLWTLPYAFQNYPQQMKDLAAHYPDDIGGVGPILEQRPLNEGDPYAIGSYRDEWGCVFTNIFEGIIGEVKEPLVQDDEWADADRVHLPEELLTFDVEQVNRDLKTNCDGLFTTGGCCPRPFEQMQFIRGTENLYMDLLLKPTKMLEFMEKMHDFYCRLLTKWAQTDVDALNMMDDWGSQNALLINPELWDELFRPMYRDYIDIAHRHGKKMFMHSDGNTAAIIPRLIDLGLDAMNAQIFCIGPENLKQYAGKITFWGEIDRQNILPYGSVADVEEAVERVYTNLWRNGGCIAQCEFGPGAKPENVEAVFRTWDRLTGRDREMD